MTAAKAKEPPVLWSDFAGALRSEGYSDAQISKARQIYRKTYLPAIQGDENTYTTVIADYKASRQREALERKKEAHLKQFGMTELPNVVLKSVETPRAERRPDVGPSRGALSTRQMFVPGSTPGSVRQQARLGLVDLPAERTSMVLGGLEGLTRGFSPPPPIYAGLVPETEEEVARRIEHPEGGALTRLRAPILRGAHPLQMEAAPPFEAAARSITGITGAIPAAAAETALAARGLLQIPGYATRAAEATRGLIHGLRLGGSRPLQKAARGMAHATPVYVPASVAQALGTTAMDIARGEPAPSAAELGITVGGAALGGMTGGGKARTIRARNAGIARQAAKTQREAAKFRAEALEDWRDVPTEKLAQMYAQDTAADAPAEWATSRFHQQRHIVIVERADRGDKLARAILGRLDHPAFFPDPLQLPERFPIQLPSRSEALAPFDVPAFRSQVGERPGSFPAAPVPPPSPPLQLPERFPIPMPARVEQLRPPGSEPAFVAQVGQRPGGFPEVEPPPPPPPLQLPERFPIQMPARVEDLRPAVSPYDQPAFIAQVGERPGGLPPPAPPLQLPERAPIAMPARAEQLRPPGEGPAFVRQAGQRPGGTPEAGVVRRSQVSGLDRLFATEKQAQAALKPIATQHPDRTFATTPIKTPDGKTVWQNEATSLTSAAAYRKIQKLPIESDAYDAMDAGAKRRLDTLLDGIRKKLLQGEDPKHLMKMAVEAGKSSKGLDENQALSDIIQHALTEQNVAERAAKATKAAVEPVEVKPAVAAAPVAPPKKAAQAAAPPVVPPAAAPVVPPKKAAAPVVKAPMTPPAPKAGAQPVVPVGAAPPAPAPVPKAVAKPVAPAAATPVAKAAVPPVVPPAKAAAPPPAVSGQAATPPIVPPAKTAAAAAPVVAQAAPAPVVPPVAARGPGPTVTVQGKNYKGPGGRGTYRMVTVEDRARNKDFDYEVEVRSPFALSSKGKMTTAEMEAEALRLHDIAMKLAENPPGKKAVVPPPPKQGALPLTPPAPPVKAAPAATARLGKTYSQNASGNRFQRVVVNEGGKDVATYDILVRKGRSGPYLMGTVEAKAEALRKHAERPTKPPTPPSGEGASFTLGAFAGLPGGTQRIFKRPRPTPPGPPFARPGRTKKQQHPEWLKNIEIPEGLDANDFIRLDKLPINDAEKANLAKKALEVAVQQGYNPKKRVTWNEQRAWAAKLSPGLLAHLKQPKAGETVAPHIFKALQNQSMELNRQEFRLRSEAERGRTGTGAEERALTREEILERIGQADALDTQVKDFLDVLIPTASQDGRNLGAHAMSAQNGFAVDYWVARARRSGNGLLSPENELKVRRLTAEGDEAQIRGDEEGVNAARRKLAAHLAKLDRTSLLETITTLFKAGLLSGLKTISRNVGGTGIFQGMEGAARVPASMLDWAVSKATDRRTVAGASWDATARALKEMSTRGVKEAMEIMRQGVTDDAMIRFDLRKELNSGSKILDAYANFIFRLQTAPDRLFKVYIMKRSLEAQARVMALNETGKKGSAWTAKRQRQIADAPTEEMITQSILDAEFGTFNNKNIIAGAIGAAEGYLKRKGGIGGEALVSATELIVPFKNTPLNVIARILDYSSFGGLVRGIGLGANRLKGARGKLIEGGSLREAIDVVQQGLSAAEQKTIVEAFGRGVIGAPLMYIGYQLAAQGLMTADFQKKPAEKAREEAVGRQWGSLKVKFPWADADWQQVGQFAPFGSMLVMGAILQKSKHGLTLGDYLNMALKTATDLPMLEGLDRALEALRQPKEKLEGFAGSVAGAFVPTMISDIAESTDVYKRQARTIGERVAVRIPGLRGTLEPKVDILGRKMPSKGGLAAFNPFMPTRAQEETDPLAREMVRLRVAIEPLDRQVEIKGVKYQLTPQLYREFATEAGELVSERWERELEKGSYEALADREDGKKMQRKRFHDLAKEARKIARERVKRLIVSEDLVSSLKVAPSEEE